MKSSTKNLWLGFLSLLASVAQARLYNYQDISLGERSSGMGQVSMALAGDEGNAFFNPAVLSWSRSNQMTASVSAYQRVDSRTGKFVSLFESALDNVKRGGFDTVPSMIGGHLQKGLWTWGGGVFVPTSFSSAGTADDGTKVFSYDGNEQDVWINAFGAYEYSPRTRFGISLFYLSKDLREKFVTSVRAGGNVETRFEERDWSVNGMSLIIGGVHTWDEDRWSVGWSLRPPVWRLGGQGQLSVIASGNDAGLGNSFTPKMFPLPARISGGLAYKFSDKFLMGLDMHFYPGFSGNLSPQKEDVFKIAAKSIANIGIGAEYFVTHGLGLRAGINSNFSAARVVPAGMSAVTDKVHMGTGTLAVVMRKDSGDLSIGAWLSGGEGYTRKFDPDDLTQTPRSIYLYGAEVASTYKF